MRLNIDGDYCSKIKDEHFHTNKTLKAGLWNACGLIQKEDSWKVSVLIESKFITTHNKDLLSFQQILLSYLLLSF
jgi:hypothetical protein